MDSPIPPIFIHTVCGVLGLLVGSFLNVVVARLPQGQSVVRPRSRCPGCGSEIAWYDNFPVLSWIALRGKCRKCRQPISARYPMIELLTGILFYAAALRFADSGLPLFLIRDLPFLAILVAVTFIDLEHRIIPNPLSLGGLVLGLATGWAAPDLGWERSFGGAALGFGIFWFFAWAYEKRSGRSGLGGGDIKLLAMIGAFLGPLGVFTTILMSSILGSVLGIIWGIAQKRRAAEGGEAGLLRISIPYGPFLVIGALYYYLLGDLVWLPFTNPT